MTILLTGASGFLGKSLLKHLLARGFTILCPVRDKAKLSAFSHPNLRVFNADIYAPHAPFLDSKIELLIHLAWENMDNVFSFSHIERNFAHSLRFLQSAIKAKIPQIAVAGSCYEYGIHFGKVAESAPCAPQCAYGKAKVFLHQSLLELQKTHDFALKWLRVFYLYGEGQNPHSLLPQLQNALNRAESHFNMSSGMQIRDYLDIKLATQYIAQIALLCDFDGVCNICSGKPISLRQVVENYLANSRQKITLNLGYYPQQDFEPLAYWGDNAKLKALLEKSNWGGAEYEILIALLARYEESGDSLGVAQTHLLFAEQKVSKKNVDFGDSYKSREILPTANPQNCAGIIDSRESSNFFAYARKYNFMLVSHNLALPNLAMAFDLRCDFEGFSKKLRKSLFWGFSARDKTNGLSSVENLSNPSNCTPKTQCQRCA